MSKSKVMRTSGKLPADTLIAIHFNNAWNDLQKVIEEERFVDLLTSEEVSLLNEASQTIFELSKSFCLRRFK